EARRDGAADQCPGAKAFGGLPAISGHHYLRPLGGFEVGPEDIFVDDSALMAEAEPERGTRVPVPDLGGIDAMPGRIVASLQQIIDRSRKVARAIGSFVGKRLPVPAT